MSEPLRSTNEPAWAAFAAIDWADQKHFWRLLAAGSQQSEQGELKNTPEAVEAWAAGLEQRFGGRPVAVCLEQTRGALVYMLAKYPHLVLFPVHPTTAARYREAFCPSGAKDDPDAREHFLARLSDSEVYVEAAESGAGIFEMDAAASAAEREQFMPIVEWVDPECRARAESKVIELSRPAWAVMSSGRIG